MELHGGCWLTPSQPVRSLLLTDDFNTKTEFINVVLGLSRHKTVDPVFIPTIQHSVFNIQQVFIT